MIVTTNDAAGLLRVEVDGLNEIIGNLRIVDGSAAGIVSDTINEAGGLVLAAARGRASAFSSSGSFRSSLDIKRIKSGIVLRSTDQAAGVIEFAKPGARTRTSKGTPLANARLAKKSGVGVPRGAANPRSMVPAVNDNALKIANKVSDALERAMLHGNS